jgi:hypothetical protein
MELSARSGINLLLADNGDDYSGRPGYINADAQWVKKSIRHYLSKYVSKAATKDIGEAVYYPSRWWGIDDTLRAAIRERRIVRTSRVMPWTMAYECWQSLAGELASVAAFCKVFTRPYNWADKTILAYLRPPNAVPG